MKADLMQSYMFEGIGVEWGMTLLGCVAALFIPMPFYLYKKGRSIRAKSKFAPAPDIEQDKRRDEESKANVSDEGTGSSSSEAEKKDLEKKEE